MSSYERGLELEKLITKLFKAKGYDATHNVKSFLDSFDWKKFEKWLLREKREKLLGKFLIMLSGIIRC